MNKKTIAILTGTVLLPAAVGCSGGSGKTYSYEVSGVVDAAQIDYECKGGLALERVAFVAGKTRPKKTGVAAPTSPTKAPARKAPTKSNGVKLSKKPDKPERVRKVKPPKYKHKPKGCHAEYELFVKNGSTLWEQDVRKTDYDNCSDKPREHFPSCTKN